MILHRNFKSSRANKPACFEMQPIHKNYLSPCPEPGTDIQTSKLRITRGEGFSVVRYWIVCCPNFCGWSLREDSVHYMMESSGSDKEISFFKTFLWPKVFFLFFLIVWTKRYIPALNFWWSSRSDVQSCCSRL